MSAIQPNNSFTRNTIKRSNSKRKFLPAVIIGGLLVSGIAISQTDVAAVMDQRHENFETIGKSFKTIRDEFKASSPDMAKIDDAAKSIASLAQELPTWFPEGTGPESGIETEAKAEIWKKTDDFAAAAEKLKTESAKFAELTAAGDAKAVMGGMRGLGGACKNCHDQFREEDE